MTDNKRIIFLVHDNPIILRTIKGILTQHNIKVFTTRNARWSLESAIELQPDIIMTAIQSREIDGLRLCERLRSDNRTASVPVVFLASEEDNALRKKAAKLGAVDFLVISKDLPLLAEKVTIMLKMIERQEILLEQANTDALTGLSNRRYFFHAMRREMLQAKIHGYPLAAMMVDIDLFKRINDRFGHLCGDMTLKKVAGLLHDNISPLDLAARFGGEEFVIMMPSATKEIAATVAERLRSIVENNRWEYDNQQFPLTISIGIADAKPGEASDAEYLIKKADAALYDAKNSGRNRVSSWNTETKDIRIISESDTEYEELKTEISNLTGKLKSQVLDTVSAFSRVMEEKDPFMISHADNVCEYSIAIAEKMNLNSEFMEKLATAAMLHDLGKIIIPTKVLQKTGPLSAKEWEIVKHHPVASAEILEPLGMFRAEVQMIRHHHEFYDGSGYPEGISKNQIPLGARILAIANIFDAYSTPRTYRPAKSSDMILHEISKCSGNRFDPAVTEAFLQAYEENSYRWPLPKQGAVVSSVLQMIR